MINTLPPLAAKSALIIVDVQHDFLPGGAMGVDDGFSILEPLEEKSKEVDLTCASRDWHTADHSSFIDFGGLWQIHCVQNTGGAELHPRIAAISDYVVDKAYEQHENVYSAFKGTDLAAFLKDKGVTRTFIGGVTSGYCVRATILDSLAAGFETCVLENAIKPFEPWTSEHEDMIKEVENLGAHIIWEERPSSQIEIEEKLSDFLVMGEDSALPEVDLLQEVTPDLNFTLDSSQTTGNTEAEITLEPEVTLFTDEDEGLNLGI